MIQKLKLKAFQAHKSSELEFCSGVNAIVGESDEGKTSIIRALYWASQNKPSGGDFISDFSKRGECSSTIVVDGNEVTRFKNKSKNEYRINDQPFKALGKSGVPDEVKSILQMDDLNFQNQMDAPFLLSKNGGDLAKYLNKVADLEIISTSLTKAKSLVDTANGDIKRKEAEVESNKAELEEYNWIDQAEKELLQLEDDNYEFKNSESLQEYLIDTLEECDDLVEALEKYTDNDDEEYQIKLLIEEFKNYQAQEIHLNSFKSDLNALESISDKIDNLPFDKKEIESIADLSTLIDSFQVEKDNYLDLDLLLVDIQQFEDKIEGCIDSIQSLETEFKKDFPDTCPLCGDIE